MTWCESENGERERERERERVRVRERQTIIYNSMLYFYLCIKAKLSPEAYPQNGKTTLAKKHWKYFFQHSKNKTRFIATSRTNISLL